MRTLATQFRKDGFDYKQVMRDGMIAIYHQTKGKLDVAYEAGRIRHNKERHQFGVVLEESESWPSSEEWGVRAWTYPDLARAKKRAFALIPSNSPNPQPAQD